MRLCDLPVKIEGTRLELLVNRLYRELNARSIPFKPHVWLGEEWFTPDGVAGFAIPFYLAHPRLMKLERSQMLEVEGAADGECMRILRHEAGHALDNAFLLHARRGWRDTFGVYGTPYPKSYQPKPGSRDFVLNLDAWYAQSHPAEDFAETFAVWLKPGSRWRRQYREWGALSKIECVDRMMAELPRLEQKKHIRCYVDPLRSLRTTLREHYHRKRRFYMIHWPELLEKNLYRIFSPDPRHRVRPSAAQFLRRLRSSMGEHVADGTGIHRYTVNHVVRLMIARCRELNLRLTIQEEEAKPMCIAAVTMQVMQFLQSGYHRIPL
jgi:hypothetical protein